jgi:hypothetical protein
MVFLQVNEFLTAGEILQNTLQLARLAGAQPELEHQFAQTESSLRILLKELEDFLLGRNFAHRGSSPSVPSATTLAREHSEHYVVLTAESL